MKDRHLSPFDFVDCDPVDEKEWNYLDDQVASAARDRWLYVVYRKMVIGSPTDDR